MYDNYSINDMTLLDCKKHNRYQREEYWRSKSITKLLLAIQQGYVPVGKEINKLEMNSKKRSQ